MKRVCSIALVLVTVLSIFACSFAAGALVPELPLDGTVVSGATTKDSHYVSYAFKLEKKGSVSFTFLADKNIQTVSLRNETTGQFKSVMTFSAADFKDNWTCQKTATMYLEKGDYTFEVYGYETEFKVNAQYKEYTLKNSSYTLSASATSDYLFNEWSTPKSHKLIVKKPYRIIFTVTHYMPIALNIKDADGNVYVSATKYKNGTADKAEVQTIVLNLKKGTYSLNLRAEPGLENACETGGIYTIGVKAKPYVKAPANLKAVTRKTDSQTVSYSALKGVDGYQVQCSDGGKKWAQTKTGTSLTCRFTNLKPGAKYKFRVRSYVIEDGKKFYGDWSEVLNSATNPEEPAMVSAASAKPAHITVQWKKGEGVCTGYEICYSNSSSFKTVLRSDKVKAGDKDLQTYTLSGFARYKVCYIRVRTFTTFATKDYYSDWSKTTSVIVK